MPVDQLEREKAPHVRPRSTSPPLAPGSPEQLYSPQERKMVEMVRAIPHFNSFTEDIMAGRGLHSFTFQLNLSLV
jgi:hypothetical protein